jgi:hypothetical protein
MGRGDKSKALRKLNRALADGRPIHDSRMCVGNSKGKREIKGHLKKEYVDGGTIQTMMSSINKDKNIRAQLLNGGKATNLEKMTRAVQGQDVTWEDTSLTTGQLKLSNLFEENDFHCWVEDKEGHVVFDPYFDEYDEIRKIRGCDQTMTVMCRKAFGEDKEKYFWDKLKTRMTEKIKYYKDNNVFGRSWVKEFYDCPKFGYCNFNCSAFLIKNKGKGYKIRVGSAGWLKDKKKWALNDKEFEWKEGQIPNAYVWWEYG